MTIKPTTMEGDCGSDPSSFLTSLTAATSRSAMRDLLASLPIVAEDDYVYDSANPMLNWKQGHLHWVPVGKDLGNAGRIKLARTPVNPIAERTINGMEALIELERLRESLRDASAPAPKDPREAVDRYFELPPLRDLPKLEGLIRGAKPRDYARELARRLRVRLVRTSRPVEYAVIIEDDGLGQPPIAVHKTLLSLGASEKPDKPYLIGVFGQGGSSAYAACEVSWIVSRRAADLMGGAADGVSWTAVKRISRRGRRDVYWAYLAAHPDGRVPQLPASSAAAISLESGTRIAHVAYNFGKTEPARTLYQSLNHLIFSPVLPYELYTRPDRAADLMSGNDYRLSLPRIEPKKQLDKVFDQLEVTMEG